MPNSMLVIEDEALLGAELARHYQSLEWEVEVAPSIAAARELLAPDRFDPLIVISDMSLPDGNAMDLLEEVNAGPNTAEWIFLTAYGGVPDSVRALHLGAFDFLEKPCELERLDLVIAGASRSARAQRRLHEQANAGTRRYSPASFVGHSAAAKSVREMLSKLSQVPFSALFVTGETGSGKGVCARIVHHSGARSQGPLVEVNCAALPADLMESELFGHEAGSFTGAKARRRGLMEQANAGTLFLDEIAELDIQLQGKLLKAIEDRRIRRVGGDREIKVDVQVVAATNREPAELVSSGRLREDLFHRMSAFRLHIPPLRERKEDLDDLVPLFIVEFNAGAGKSVKVVPPEVWERLRNHRWPGNVRELRNVVERCVLFADSDVLPARWLQLDIDTQPATSITDDHLLLPLDGSMALDEMERFIIQTALERHELNVTATARALGTTRETLRYRIQKYNLKTS